MVIQSDGRGGLSGSWDQPGDKHGTLSNGRFTNGALTFDYFQPWNSDCGTCMFTSSADGRNFSGYYNSKNGTSGSWSLSNHSGEQAQMVASAQVLPSLQGQGTQGVAYSDANSNPQVVEALNHLFERLNSRTDKGEVPLQALGDAYADMRSGEKSALLSPVAGLDNPAVISADQAQAQYNQQVDMHGDNRVDGAVAKPVDHAAENTAVKQGLLFGLASLLPGNKLGNLGRIVAGAVVQEDQRALDRHDEGEYQAQSDNQAIARQQAQTAVARHDAIQGQLDGANGAVSGAYYNAQEGKLEAGFKTGLSPQALQYFQQVANSFTDKALDAGTPAAGIEAAVQNISGPGSVLAQVFQVDPCGPAPQQSFAGTVVQGYGRGDRGGRG